MSNRIYRINNPESERFFLFFVRLKNQCVMLITRFILFIWS